MRAYLNDNDRLEILRSHEIIINNVMNQDIINFSQPIVLNRNINQLLNGCKLLREQLPDLIINNRNYEMLFEQAFHNNLLTRNANETFIEWINRNQQVITDGGLRFYGLRHE
jgi:hypothetical protein